MKSSSAITIQQYEETVRTTLQRLASTPLPSELEALRLLAPAGTVIEVACRHDRAGSKHPRKARRDCPFENWNEKAHILEIRIVPGSEPSGKAPERSAALPSPEPRKEGQGEDNGPHPPANIQLKQQFRDVIIALAEAEARPGFEFVALKRFRDGFLPTLGYGWAAQPIERGTVIREAIEREFFLTRKIPNPRNPDFPVTAITLNRQHPQVQAVLYGSSEADSDFEPLEIPGEPLSATILRERR